MATVPAIPKIPGLPIFGNAFQFAACPTRFLSDNAQRYGSLFKIRVPPNREIIAVADPEWFAHVLIDNQKNYVKDPTYRQLGLALGNGLLLNEGESWYRQRRLAQPAFYKTRLNALIKVMDDITDGYMLSLREQAGTNIRVDSYMTQVTSDVVIATLLGNSFKEEFRFIQSQIRKLQEHLADRIRMPLSIPFSYLNGKHAAFKRTLARLDEKIYQVISERRKKGVDGNELMSMLMSARDEDTNELMSDKQLRDELVTMYIAGHETSAYCLSWTLYLLTQYPEKLAKLREEVDSVFKSHGGKLDVERIRELRYARQVVDESLRLYPTAPIISREVVEDDHIGPFTIRKGTWLLLVIANLHRDPKYWKDPATFVPERFDPDQGDSRPKNVYLPFGTGPRTCIGNNFALMEIVMVLSKLVYNFDIYLPPGQTIEPEHSITLKPKHGCHMQFTPRNSMD